MVHEDTVRPRMAMLAPSWSRTKLLCNVRIPQNKERGHKDYGPREEVTGIQKQSSICQAHTRG